MRKTLSVVLVILFVFPFTAFAKDLSTTASFKALKMDKYPQNLLETLVIQAEVGKVFLNEYENAAKPEMSPEDKKKGYGLFIRNYLFDVSAFSSPSKNEFEKKEIKILASLGEYEPVVFSVYPLEALKKCAITLSDFLNGKGGKLPGEAFQINNVIHRPIGNDNVVVKGELLLKTKEIEHIEAGVNKTVWINVLIPENAQAGVYKGKLTFSPAGKPGTEIPVEIKVLPFKLKQPPDISWAPIMAGSFDLEELEKELLAIKEHGMTGEVTGCLMPKAAREGEVPGDFSYANKYMELAKKIGLPGRFVLHGLMITGTSRLDSNYCFAGRGAEIYTQKTYTLLKETVQGVKANAEKNKWLPYVIYLSSELGSSSQNPVDFNTVMKGAESFYAAAREVPGVKLLATFNRQEELALHAGLPALDETGFNGEMYPGWEKAAKQKPSWMTFVEIDQRLGYGLYLWKFNLKGARPWCLKPGIMYPREQGLLYYINKEMLPSVRFERIREGVDDYKYMYTLSELIKEAKAKGKDAKTAEEVVRQITEKIPHDHKSPTKSFAYENLDDYRRQIGEEILKLLN